MKHIHHKFFSDYSGRGGGFSALGGDWPDSLPFQEGDTNCLYLIFNPLTECTKIGISADPFRRFRELQNGSGTELWFLFRIEFALEIDASAKFIERYIHKHFAEYRVKGEWFYLSLRNLVAIRSLLWEIHGDDIIDNFKELLEKYKHVKEQPA